VKGKARRAGPVKDLALIELRAHVSNVQFEWDAAKAASNLAKHGVTFDQGIPRFLRSRPPHRG
jgi:hypothetical protein